MSATALFYHLTRLGLDDLVTMLVTRAVGQGWRVMLRSPSPAELDHLDARLWLGPDDGFLPHGLQGGPHDAGQPVLLGPGVIANQARALMLLSGAEVGRDETGGLERLWIVFDGADDAAVAKARAQWAELTGWGLAAQYWSDESGAWVKKTERPASA